MASGLFTFLLTDIEGSTALWEQNPKAMERALETHDALIGLCIQQNGGEIVKARGEGDSHFSVFHAPSGALMAAAAIQRSIAMEEWPTSKPIRVRIAVHTGEIQRRDGEYYGISVNKAARLRSIAHGGQVVLSLASREIALSNLAQGHSLKDLGEHRLKDLMRPERVFQLTGPGLEEQFPPLLSLRPERNNLPLQLTSFIGREAEIREVALKCMKSRLVTLVGPGGCGKTRLSLQVAADISDEFSGGVWFVDLTTITLPEATAGAAARALRIPESSNKEPIDAICETFGAEPALIILDNCEHLGGAPGRLADALMRRLPSLTILATSRRPLDIQGETNHLVEPLQVPGAAETDLDTLKDCESARLMLDRATAAAPNFKLGPENAASFAVLCRDLEGMPLAIELAASKLRMLSVDQLRGRLNQSLDLLKSSGFDRDDRHGTMRATIDWSYKQLRPEEQAMLVRLSLFPAGCTLEAAEKVAAFFEIDSVETFDLVEKLVLNSLLQPSQDSVPRYRMLETIRQYAEENASPELLLRSREALYEWALELARRTKPLLLGGEQDHWLGVLEEEYPNLRRALEISTDLGGEENKLGVLTSELDRFWQRKGMIREGRDWLEGSLSSSGTIPAQTKGLILRSSGTFALYQKHYELAACRLQQSLDSFRESGNEQLLAGSLTNLGILSSETGAMDKALNYYAESLEINLKFGDDQLVANCYLNLGATAHNAGRWEEAEQHYQNCVKFARKADDKFMTAYALANRANLLGPKPASVELLADALELSRELHNVIVTGLSLFVLARIAHDSGRTEIGCKLLGCCVAVREAEGIIPNPKEMEVFERIRAELTEELGPENYLANFEYGNAVARDDVLDYALTCIQMLRDVSHVA